MNNNITYQPEIITHFSTLADNYQGCIIDLWGVVHDGRTPYPGSREVMDKLRAAGKKVCLLSNAPSRVHLVKQHLTGMGISGYDFLMTSGEMVWQGLKQRIDPEFAGLGGKCFIMGYPDGQPMLKGLDLELCRNISDADFAWCVQVPEDDYRPWLYLMLERNMPLICANPDLEVLFNGELMACPGDLAGQYERMGGKVIYRGKPFAHGYEACFEFCGTRQLAAIGDGMLTDILGARQMGLDSYLIAGGIHGAGLGLDPQGMPAPGALFELFNKYGFRPTATMPCLRW